MDQTTLAKYLAGYAQPAEQASASSQTNHLKLDWEQTLEFQAKGQNKFQQFLQIEQEFTRDSDCKPKEIIGGCKALTKYQELKSNDVTGAATIVYRSSREDEAIQITNYLNWIKANYGTTLSFKAANGVKAK